MSTAGSPVRSVIAVWVVGVWGGRRRRRRRRWMVSF